MRTTLRTSTRARWVKSMHAAHARRLLPHVLAHPRDKQAAALLTKTLAHTHWWTTSPFYAASARLHEHSTITHETRPGRGAVTVSSLRTLQ